MPQQTILPLFVYGSLRSGFQHPAYAYISRYFTLVGKAKVKGQLYDMGEYPAAIAGDAEQLIVGELYQIKDPAEFSWAIAQLDDYEGIFPEPGETALYKREETMVVMDENGQQEKAWIYWYNGSVEGYPHIACGDLLEYIEQKKKA